MTDSLRRAESVPGVTESLQHSTLPGSHTLRALFYYWSIYSFALNRQNAVHLKRSNAVETKTDWYLQVRREDNCSSSAVWGWHCCWPPEPWGRGRPRACRQSSRRTVTWSWRTPPSGPRWSETVGQSRRHFSQFRQLVLENESSPWWC